MSMQAINFALNLPIDEPGPRLTLICIAFHIGYRTGDMFVSQDELAAEVRVTARSVRTYLAALESAGYIKREERRGENGHRSSDRIELIGYLEWQAVLETGGTISDPRKRGKISEQQPENFAGSDEANRKTSGVQPEKKASPTGNCFPVHMNHTNHNITTSAREGACVDGAAPSRAEGRKPDARPQVEITVKRGDASWQNWLERLRDAGQRELAASIEDAGALTASSRWYAPANALPRPAPSAPVAALSTTSKRITGEAAE
jgi:hypothetical protein